MIIPVKRLHPDAKLPTRAHDTDAGADLYALITADRPEQFIGQVFPLRPGERRLYRTGIAMALPAGFYGHICDRSGNALKRGLHVMGGIVDSSYRGDIGVILFNAGQDPVWIEPGERVAQIIIKAHESPTFEETESLDATQRGSGGFGSTGTV